jgi:hypothetical protein
MDITAEAAEEAQVLVMLAEAAEAAVPIIFREQALPTYKVMTVQVVLVEKVLMESGQVKGTSTIRPEPVVVVQEEVQALTVHLGRMVL